MGNEKHYDYYKTSPECREELRTEFDENVRSKRADILEELQKDTGCIAWTERSSWGFSTVIDQLVYPLGHAILEEPYIKRGNKRKLEDQDVICVSGMGNRKLGKQFNAKIAGYNKRLKEFPQYKDWLIENLDISRTGIGGEHSSGRGMAMLSTAAGDTGNVIVARIPNNDDKKHGDTSIPDCLKKITYGEFYDLTH